MPGLLRTLGPVIAIALALGFQTSCSDDGNDDEETGGAGSGGSSTGGSSSGGSSTGGSSSGGSAGGGDACGGCPDGETCNQCMGANGELISVCIGPGVAC